MKRTLNILLIVGITFIIASCGGNHKNADNNNQQDTINKVNQTVENLKAALQGETTASHKYEAFAKKAKEENFPQIAVLLSAVSKSKSIHAANHKKVLNAMGETPELKEETFSVKSTLENLEAAYNGEKHETENMYPAFIEQAKTDKADKAIKSFNWAMGTEELHMEYYQAAIDALKAKKEKSLPTEYFVCSKCGYTYTKDNIEDNCDQCGTEKGKFFAIK